MRDCNLRLSDEPSLLTKDTEDGFVSQLKASWQNKSILTGALSKFTGNKGVYKLYPIYLSPYLQVGLKTVGSMYPPMFWLTKKSVTSWVVCLC